MTSEDATAGTDGDGDGGGGVSISRRELLGAGIGAALGVGASVAGPSVVTADPQGGLGTNTNPLQAAYLEELRGPITEFDTPITQLVDHRVAEDGASISPANETLVFRYDPNTTV